MSVLQRERGANKPRAQLKFDLENAAISPGNRGVLLDSEHFTLEMLWRGEKPRPRAEAQRAFRQITQ